MEPADLNARDGTTIVAAHDLGLAAHFFPG
jgi:hypothetical protein